MIFGLTIHHKFGFETFHTTISFLFSRFWCFFFRYTFRTLKVCSAMEYIHYSIQRLTHKFYFLLKIYVINFDGLQNTYINISILPNIDMAILDMRIYIDPVCRYLHIFNIFKTTVSRPVTIINVLMLTELFKIKICNRSLSNIYILNQM